MTTPTRRRRPVPPARQYFFPSASRTPDQEQAVEDAFFRSLRMANGTYKTTARDRMPEVDELVARSLAAEGRSAGNPVRVLDIGISSGVTTVDLLERLDARGVPTRTVAADLVVRAWLRRLASWLDVLVDADGHVLQLATPWLVKGRPHDPQGSLPRRLLQAAIGFAEGRVARRRPPAPGDEPVLLISQRLAHRPDVEVVEHDVGLWRPEWQGRFDLVRAANLLNLDYFDRPTLARMLGNLRSYLAPGGLLLVCRTTDDGVNAATLFRNAPDGLDVVGRVGAGSEVEDLALGVQPAAA